MLKCCGIDSVVVMGRFSLGEKRRGILEGNDFLLRLLKTILTLSAMIVRYIDSRVSLNREGFEAIILAFQPKSHNLNVRRRDVLDREGIESSSRGGTRGSKNFSRPHSPEPKFRRKNKESG